MKRVEQVRELEAAVAGKKAVVLFFANWCPFCRDFLPLFEETTRGGAFEPVEVVLDDESNPLWELHRVEVVPTVILFEDGAPVRRFDGKPMRGLTARDASVLKEAIGSAA